MSTIENKVSRLETDVSVMSHQVSDIKSDIGEVKDAIKKQTELLSAMLVLQEKHANLRSEFEESKSQLMEFKKEFKTLNEDRKEFQTKIMTGVKLISAIIVLFQGFVVTIVSERASQVKSTENKVHELQLKVEELRMMEARNHKSPHQIPQ